MSANLFPMTKIRDLSVSRLMVGSNMFFGFSHFSDARSEWLKKHFTNERIAEVLAACMEEGLNTVVSGPQPRLYEAIQMAKKATKREMNWVVTPGGGGPVGGTIEEQVRWCADHDGKVCMPHTGWTDSRLLIHENRIAELEPVLALIRKLGMATGLSTHRPEVLVVGEKAGYDLDCYIQPYNSIGFLCSVETDWTGNVIRNTPKPVICIKPFGAGRIMPITGFPFVYGSIKAIDPVCFGAMSVEEAKEDIALARQILAGQTAETKLQFTRSKAALMPAGAAPGDCKAKGRRKK